MRIAKSIARACYVRDYRARLLRNPLVALAGVGGEPPAGETVVAIENRAGRGSRVDGRPLGGNRSPGDHIEDHWQSQ